MSFATADERFFVSLVNNTRKEMGLAPLKIAKPLNEAADGHTQWMLDSGTFSHTGEGGSRASERIEEAGFPMVGESWGTRENLGYIGVTGVADLHDEIRQMHQNLLDSPSHRKNILDPDLEYIGIGPRGRPLRWSDGPYGNSELRAHHRPAANRHRAVPKGS